MSHLPFDLKIAIPCTQDWTQMSGDSKRRHCAQCNKQVHNLATKTTKQIARLVEDTNGDFCARIAHRANGDVVFAGKKKPNPATTAVFAMALSLTTIAAAQDPTAPAVISGQVLTPEGLPPASPIILTLKHTDGQTFLITANQDGTWSKAVTPGVYDVAVYGGVELNISEVRLHPGQQTFGIMQTHYRESEMVTGEIMPISKAARIRYRLRHPISYAAALIRRRTTA